MGLYRARVEEAGGEARRFRLLLFAAAPDRIHGEILTPVGTTVVMIDGGGDRLAITLPREATTFVGPPDPAVLESLIGTRLSLQELVGALLGEEVTLDGIVVTRSAGGSGRLPERFAIEGPEGRLLLERKRWRRLEGDTGDLGRGEPVAGTRLRPLSEFVAADLPAEALEADP